MKKTYLLFVILTLFILSCNAQAKEKKLVKKAFEDYKHAILTDKGTLAVTFVDSRTIQYYSNILKNVKSSDSAIVSSLPLMDKIMVFSIRHRATNEEIKSFDGKSLLIYAINKGMVGKNSVTSNTIGDVVVDGNFAKGQLINNGQEMPIYFHFYKEDEKWKVDLTSVFAIANQAMKQMINNSGQSENEYVFELLEIITNKKPGREIWNKIE